MKQAHNFFLFSVVFLVMFSGMSIFQEGPITFSEERERPPQRSYGNTLKRPQNILEEHEYTAASSAAAVAMPSLPLPKVHLDDLEKIKALTKKEEINAPVRDDVLEEIERARPTLARVLKKDDTNEKEALKLTVVGVFEKAEETRVSSIKVIKTGGINKKEELSRTPRLLTLETPFFYPVLKEVYLVKEPLLFSENRDLKLYKPMVFNALSQNKGKGLTKAAYESSLEGAFQWVLQKKYLAPFWQSDPEIISQRYKEEILKEPEDSEGTMRRPSFHKFMEGNTYRKRAEDVLTLMNTLEKTDKVFVSYPTYLKASQKDYSMKHFLNRRPNIRTIKKSPKRHHS